MNRNKGNTQRGRHAASNAPKASVSVSVSVSLSLCLCQKNLHMRVAIQAPTRTVHALLCQQQKRLSSRSIRSSETQRSQVFVCLCSQQYSFQLGPPSSDSMRAAQSVRTGRCRQITQQLGALTAQSSKSLEDQSSHGRTTALRLLRFPSNCSHSWFRRTFVATFCMRASHADVNPELLQDAREPGDHIQDGAPHHKCCFVVVSHPVVELREMALQVRVAPCLLNEPAQGVLNRTVPGSPLLAAKRVERVRRQRVLAHVSIVALPQSARGARACIWRGTEP